MLYMATKNGFYSDGWYKNGAGPYAIDDVQFHNVVVPGYYLLFSNSGGPNQGAYLVTFSKDDGKLRTYTNRYNGNHLQLYTGILSGKAYKNGDLLNGFADDVFSNSLYKNGLPFTGLFNVAEIGTNWPNSANESYPQSNQFFKIDTGTATTEKRSVPSAGIAAGLQYGNDGLLADNIIINSKMYAAGLPASGWYADYETGSYRMRLYKVGKPYTGFSIEAIDNDGNYPTNSLVLNSTGRVGLLTYVYANWLNYSGMNDPINSNGCYFYNGELANGEINNKIWTDGVFDPSGGDIVSNGRLFRNGVPFSGKLVMNNGSVTFAGTSIVLVPGELTTKDAFFAAGVLMHGLLGGKVYNYGAPDLTGGYKQQTLMYYNGAVVNGFIGDEKYINGKAW